MFNKNPFVVKKSNFEDLNVNITSMVDIFVIVLVFLLKSYSTNAIKIIPSSGVQLPVADAAPEEVSALQVEISEKTIQVDNRPVVKLENFRINGDDIQNNGTSGALNESLKAQKKKQLLIAQYNKSVHADQKLMVIADQRTPYSTIKAVLASAIVNGFADFKLVVARKE